MLLWQCSRWRSEKINSILPGCKTLMQLWEFLVKQRVGPRDIVARECGVFVWIVIYSAFIFQVKSSAFSNSTQSISGLYLLYIWRISYKAEDLEEKSVLALVAGEVTAGHGTGSKAIRASSQEERQSWIFPPLNTGFCEPPLEELCPVFNWTLETKSEEQRTIAGSCGSNGDKS